MWAADSCMHYEPESNFNCLRLTKTKQINPYYESEILRPSERPNNKMNPRKLFYEWLEPEPKIVTKNQEQETNQYFVFEGDPRDSIYYRQFQRMSDPDLPETKPSVIYSPMQPVFILPKSKSESSSSLMPEEDLSKRSLVNMWLHESESKMIQYNWVEPGPEPREIFFDKMQTRVKQEPEPEPEPEQDRDSKIINFSWVDGKVVTYDFSQTEIISLEPSYESLYSEPAINGCWPSFKRKIKLKKENKTSTE